MSTPIPVTLITGFLGAGKTTLLNHILETDGSRQFAVIENEFGGVGIDGLRVRQPSETLFELNGGCVCCSVRSDLLAALHEIAAQKTRFDHVIIETTGLAEPAPVLRLFERTDIRSAFTLDGVVTVVDGMHLQQSLAEVTACLEQLIYADLIMINKADLLVDQSLSVLEKEIRQINPLATVERAQFGQIDLPLVLEMGGATGGKGIESLHPTDPDSHSHDEGIKAIGLEAKGNVNLEALDYWLGDLVRRREANVLRMKGMIAVQEDERSFVFNGVRDIVDVKPDRLWGEQKRVCKLVFIGRGLDRRVLQQGLDSCMANPSEEITEYRPTQTPSC